MNTYLLRRDCIVETMRSASVRAEPVPFLRNSVGWKRAWLDHRKHTGEFIYDVESGLDSKWIRRQDETGYAERLMRFRQTREPLDPGLLFGPSARLYDHIYSCRARTHWGDYVFAEHQIRRRNQYGQMHCWNRSGFFSVLAHLRAALYPHGAGGWQKNNEGPRELYISTPVVFAYFSHHLLLDFGSGLRLRDFL